MDLVTRLRRRADRSRVARHVVPIGPRMLLCTLGAGDCRSERDYARFVTALVDQYGPDTLVLAAVPAPPADAASATGVTPAATSRLPFATAAPAAAAAAADAGGKGPSPLDNLKWLHTVAVPAERYVCGRSIPQPSRTSRNPSYEQ